MIRYTLAGFLLLISICSRGADTTAVIHGKVFDAGTLEPLVAAYIIYGNYQGVITDNNGHYKLTASPGNTSITFRYIGYKSITRTVTLNPYDTIELNIGLEQDISGVYQIVVSANRTEQKLSDLAVSVSIIKPELLTREHITDPQELINKTSGIEVLDGQASIRGGSGFSYGAGSRVLALIDGLPVLAADAGNIKWQFLPLENLSQVEIIKGASSVLYGSSALNGIINFRTADPGNEPVTTYSAEAGIFDRPRQKKWIWWDVPRVFSNISVAHLQKKGNTDIAFGASLLFDNGYRRLNDEKLARMNLSIRHHHKKKERLTYGFRLNGGYNLSDDFVLWEDAEQGALKQDTSTAQLLHGSFLALDPFISLKKNDHNRHDLRFRLQSTQNKFPERGQNNSNALSLYSEYQLLHSIFEKMDLTCGVSENNSLIISPFYGDHKGMNIAGFAQVDYRPVNRLKMIAGLRVEQNFLDNDPDRLVPVFRTGINYQPAKYTFLRASFGQGYRYPSIAEKHASTTLGAVTIFPNPYILPESGWNSEVGLKQGILIGDMNGQADLSLFYSQNKDLIEYVFGLYPDPTSGSYGLGFQATNIEHSRVYGLETEVMLNHTLGNFHYSAEGGYIFMYPVEFNKVTGRNTDVYLKFRRKHSVKLNLSGDYRKLEMGFTLYARSKILNIDDVFLNELTRENILPGFYDYWMNDNKGYFLMDGSIGYRINERYHLSLVVKNVTNTEYMGRPGDIRPQRSFSLRFSSSF